MPNPSKVLAVCAITPSEGENLLDATQRHLSADWNTDDWYAPLVPANGEHPVDYPNHTSPNTAGAIIVRYYQGIDTCSDNAGSVTCSGPATSPVYFALRDTATGCPFTASSLGYSNMGLGLVYGGGTPNSTATENSSFAPNVDPTPYSTTGAWLDQSSQTNHVMYANSIRDACYSDGSQVAGNYLGNIVAWSRSPEYLVLPAPDDAYIGGSISSADLSTLNKGTCPNTTITGHCVLQLQFQLPSMPNTPCVAPYSSCSLTGNESLRYYSLTFGYLNQTGSQSYVSNPDGLNMTSPNGVSLLSLSDKAFDPATTVNLVVNLDPKISGTFDTWAQSTNSPVIQGVSPGANGAAVPNFTAFQVGSYTAVDLTQAAGFSGLANNSAALEMYIRNTLPGNFAQSGQAVPYSTAQYLGSGSGIMGPYVPIVSYVPFPGLPATPTQNLQTSAVPPANEEPFINTYVSPPSTVQYFPQQYWNHPMGAPTVEKLNCGMTPSPGSPQIDFVGTQFSVPVDNSANGGPTGCNVAASNCSQIFAQNTQVSGGPSQMWQPGLPLTIEGSGFGFLPEATLPYATSGWGSTAYLTVQDTNGTSTWSSPNSNPNSFCQMLILNWTPTGITVIPNIAPMPTNGYGVAVSALTETGPFSLAGAPGCPVASKDTITVTVINPQTGVSEAISNVPVSTFTGTLN